MSKLSPELGKFFVKMAQDMSATSGEKLTTNRAEAVLQEDQRSEVVVRGFRLVQDEPSSVMGTGRGPTPTDFFVASVALCENVIFARTAATTGVQIDSLETVVSGTWDMKGLFEIGGADSSFKGITVETRVSTAGAKSEVVEVARMTHRRCPLYCTLRKAVPILFRLILNGEEVPI